MTGQEHAQVAADVLATPIVQDQTLVKGLIHALLALSAATLARSRAEWEQIDYEEARS